MLEDYLEDFRLLEGDELPDLMGGSQSAYSPGLLFRAGVTATPGEPVSAGDHPALRLRPMLLHEWDVTLAPGDRVEAASATARCTASWAARRICSPRPLRPFKWRRCRWNGW